jgi:hypothetical protein
LTPLSQALSELKGFSSYYLVKPITHMMFMDDLKLHEESRVELLEAVHFVDDISSG